jgi:hypothetical protein
VLKVEAVVQHNYIQGLLQTSLALLCWQNSASSINCHSFNDILNMKRTGYFGGKDLFNVSTGMVKC